MMIVVIPSGLGCEDDPSSVLHADLLSAPGATV